MAKGLTAEAARQFEEQGFLAPVPALSPVEAEAYRSRFELARAFRPEIAERVLKMKSHLVFGCLDELVRLPAILDAVESLIGTDILAWTSSIFARPPAEAEREVTRWREVFLRNAAS